MFYRLMKYVFVGPLVRALFRVWVVNGENVPAKGRVVLASNHLSFVDSIILPLYMRRRVSFLAKSEYYSGRGIKGWATKNFMKATGQLPIDRTGGKASEASLAAGMRVLEKEDVLGIYPEGTRSPDGRLYRGRTGIARLALESGATIVPVAMIDTEKVMPIGTRLPRIRRMGIVFGQPLEFSRFAGMENDRFVLRAITDEIIHDLQDLSGQEYVDVYASSVKHLRPAKLR